MRSDASSVEEYLKELPDIRREAVATVREMIVDNLPAGFEGAMNWGMICYQVPLSTYPETYNGQPLMYAALASQKNHMAVYLSGIYMSQEARKRFEEDYKKMGKRLDAGESCVRFRKLEDLPVDLIGATIASMQVAEFVAGYEDCHSFHRGGRKKRK